MAACEPIRNVDVLSARLCLAAMVLAASWAGASMIRERSYCLNFDECARSCVYWMLVSVPLVLTAVLQKDPSSGAPGGAIDVCAGKRTDDARSPPR